ncbi:MAG: acetyl-CoA carboxylase biotin carboxyl carrier protein [Candidatus Acidiferrales bacterium]
MAKKSNPQAAAEAHPKGVDLREVEQLLAFMEKHGLEEFEYERDGVRVRLKKPSAHSQSAVRAFAAPEVHGAAGSSHASAHAAPTPASASAHAPAAGAPAAEDLHVIKSPIVGTFYSSASPGADPFVSVGAQVTSGQVLCIIEAMKLMNEIESDVAGEIVRIFAENGQPVEYGEPLFGIRERGKK